MPDREERSKRFLSLHEQDRPLLLANAWDVGSARLFASLGFQALASTSGGHAASLGRLDYGVQTRGGTRPRGHARRRRRDTRLGRSGGLLPGAARRCGGDDPDGARCRSRGLLDRGLGLARGQPSIDPSWPLSASPPPHRWRIPGRAALVLTARAENYLRGNPDLDDTIARLRPTRRPARTCSTRPAWTASSELGELIAAVDRPVNVLVKSTTPTGASSWPRSGSSGSRWAAPLPSSPTAPPRTRRVSGSTGAPTCLHRARGAGSKLAREAFGG